MSRHQQYNPIKAGGISAGSAAHRILLALRAPGGMSREQVLARVAESPSTALSRLAALGLTYENTAGRLLLTESGRALVAADGPLARRQSENVYCQL